MSVLVWRGGETQARRAGRGGVGFYVWWAVPISTGWCAPRRRFQEMKVPICQGPPCFSLWRPGGKRSVRDKHVTIASLGCVTSTLLGFLWSRRRGTTDRQGWN